MAAQAQDCSYSSTPHNTGLQEGGKKAAARVIPLGDIEKRLSGDPREPFFLEPWAQSFGLKKSFTRGLRVRLS